MSFPAPVPGLVIRYSYLWRAQHLQGQEEGVKDRPCAVILVVRDSAGDDIVTVLPITHMPPSDLATALEIPAATKARLGLDDERSWIVLTEANRFVWPGPDLRPAIQGVAQSAAYGVLPARFYDTLRNRFLELRRTQRPDVVTRTE